MLVHAKSMIWLHSCFRTAVFHYLKTVTKTFNIVTQLYCYQVTLTTFEA
jgi:hypothetical protein